jgi:hypothetical protein
MNELKNFAIMRFEKISSLNEVTRSLLHIFREQNTPNADPARGELNENLITKITTCAEQSIDLMKERIKRLDKPPRSNAVLAVEIIFTASPEAMTRLNVNQRRQYFKDSVKWFGKKVGADNILIAQIHRDENCEHLHLIVIPVPVGENNLNCRKLIGGHKSRASDLQDEFYDSVAKNYGLTRGKRGSRQTHQSLREHSALVSQELPKLRAEKLELKLECDELGKHIVRGQAILQNLTTDIKKTLEEHSQAIRYCFTALKERLQEKWGMIYEGNGKYTRQGEDFINEVIDKPTERYAGPSFKR